jgi:hypothetical protein
MMVSMRRLARHLFTFVSAVSMLLCLAVCVLWVRSRHPIIIYESGDPRTASGSHGVLVFGGDLSFQKHSNCRRIPDSPDGIIQGQAHVDDGWDILGFQYYETVTVAKTFAYKPLPGTYGNHAEFWIPLGWPLFVTSIFPLLCASRLTRSQIAKRRLAKAGLCCICGYDLRATPERCPECGTPAPAKAAT